MNGAVIILILLDVMAIACWAYFFAKEHRQLHIEKK